MSGSDRAEIMMRQAPMTCHEWMYKAVETIDNQFGEGYAKEHPELVGDFLKACGSDQEAMATLHLAEIIEGTEFYDWRVEDAISNVLAAK